MTLNSLIDLLKKENYKITLQRKAILQVLLENISTLITAEKLLEMSKKLNSKINMSTIYRNIDILTAMNLLYKSIDSQGITKLKLICTDEHHHHLVCDVCGKIVIYDDCDFSRYAKFARKHNFTLTGHTLELHGICFDCSNKTS